MSILADPSFHTSIRIGGKFVDGRFVVPSGIRCTNGATIKKVLEEISPVGIVTTKSISALPREGYREPIYGEYSFASYINAVGLANPGAEAFRAELSRIRVPSNKLLLVSLFGASVAEYVQAARMLECVADAFELNMSCPHVKGYGIEIGHDLKLVAEITRGVAEATSLPVIVKLPATCRDIGETAKVAFDAGATGISAINTVGPAMHCLAQEPLLSNGIGGLSGTAIKPLGLSSVKRIRTVLGPGPLIIGMGGISTAEDVREYRSVGADFFGVGSALTGMDSSELKRYFSALQEALLTDRSYQHALSHQEANAGMKYRGCRVAKTKPLAGGLFKMELDDPSGYLDTVATAGRFFFLCVPGVGEKPFAIFSQRERSFVIRVVGMFTKYLSELPEGSTVYIRGPYGHQLPLFSQNRLVLVGGGTGIVPLFEIARAFRENNKLAFFLGGRTSEHIVELDKFKELGEVNIATEDGSIGLRGNVTALMDTERCPDGAVFINSGPREMVMKCFEIQRRLTAESNIWGSIPYRTSCGVGICGKCSTAAGFLSCVDGPFLPMASILQH